MPAMGTANVRYLTIWVTSSGVRRFTSHGAESDAFRSFKEAHIKAPIWATVIRFNSQTLEAKVLKYEADRD